jgi:hypothetical protein
LESEVMPRPEEKVHIPLDFKEALGDLLKVKPQPTRKKAAKPKRDKKTSAKDGR